MKIDVIGGGPAGLYFAILKKRRDPDAAIDVWERDRPGDTFGWGVVFSEATLDNLEEADPESFRAITENFAYWDEVHTHYQGERIASGGNGFCGIERKRLLNLLQARAGELGVALHYESEIEDPARFAESDLVVAADGVNSRIRERFADHFRPAIDTGKAPYIWLGSTRPFDAFTFFFKENEHGFWQVHAYQFNEEMSTFIVECSETALAAAGLEAQPIEATVAYLEALFAEELDGHPLLVNKSEWIRFKTVACERWSRGHLVLMGDAAHTAHFSIGSGTKLAMEDSICLDVSLAENDDDVPKALADYEEERRWFVERLQATAKESRIWFEDLWRRKHFTPRRLAYALMTRNKRLGHDKLWLRDEAYVTDVNRWFAEEAGADFAPGAPPPPMFAPFRLRGLELRNRVVCSPMCQYSADDGTVDDWHLVHLGSRAVGGAGLLITEMTDVSRDARITPGCAGMYEPEHVAAWKRVVDFVHARSDGKIGMQIAHAGQKGATKLMWEEIDAPLDEGAWPIVAASAVKYRPDSQTPKPMDRADMDRVQADFVRAAGMADEAGFDLLEVHMAHGYLLASFLSPLTNRRDDEYGGDLEGRMRYPLEVFAAVRAAWPEEKPMSVRISAVDWHPDGQTIEDSIEVAKALKALGCDVIDVSSGHTSLEEDPEYARCYQVPFSERIRHEADLPTMTVGAISSHGEINAILASGCADLVALARPHLFNPYFAGHAAAQLEYTDHAWPVQYLAGVPEPREKLRWFEREKRKRRRRFT